MEKGSFCLKTERDEETNSSESISDDDNEVICEKFLPCTHIIAKELGCGQEYILYLSATSETNPYICAALSNYSCELLSIGENQCARIARLEEHSKKLVNCKFSPRNNSLVYTGSSDGTIKLWDIRKPSGSAITFEDTTRTDKSFIRPLTSFDVSPCDRILAAGSEVHAEDPYILFWDVRNRKLLGGYWESHSDDITQVLFHPENTNRLISGSTDGLINIYNLLEVTEEDALEECLNTEELVEILQWFNENGKYKISCITSTHNLQLWNLGGTEPYQIISRQEVTHQTTASIDYVPGSNVYLISTHPVRDSLLLLFGTNNSFNSNMVSKQGYFPAFHFKNTKNRVISSWLNENTNVLVTGGETGLLEIWKPDFDALRRK